jgi:Uma2 family endonuclease
MTAIDHFAVPRPLTAADLAALPDDVPSGTLRLELDYGRLVVLPHITWEQSTSITNVVAQLQLQGYQRGHSVARSRVAVILRRNPDRVVVPPASFVAKKSLPVTTSTEGFLETVPDLVIEVRGRHDGAAELARKAGEYLAAGAKLVWVIDPLRSLAIVYQVGHPPRTLAPADDLTADGIIPGFRLSVADALRV